MATKNTTYNNDLRSARDTIESIWVAIVLAFVLRAFVVEAFYIPTGSMAGGLYGNHWSVSCESCHRRFAFGAGNLPSCKTMTCPNCGYSRQLTKDDAPKTGDRVLVLKYFYQFANPKPWDVIVFKNPQNNHQNYIKRLIGLPGQSIEIIHGDIFVGATPTSPRQILRKPHRVQKAMWQVIHDFDYPAGPEIADREPAKYNNPAPPRWLGETGNWVLTSGNTPRRTLGFSGSEELSKIRLSTDKRHFLPYYGYNARQDTPFDPNRDVITDLKLAVSFIPSCENAEVSLGLTSLAHQFEVTVSADGIARLFYRPDGNSKWRLSASAVDIGKTAPGGVRRIALSHADFQAILWVDGKVVLSKKYDPDIDKLRSQYLSVNPQWNEPKVSISGKGGAFELRHVSLMRDVYYTCPNLAPKPQNQANEYQPLYDYADTKSGELGKRIVDGGPGWATAGYPLHLEKDRDNPDCDEFFVLGDNSPRSLDGRGWVKASPTLRLLDDDKKPQYQLGTIPRYNLLGRAMFVYWPAGYNFPIINKLPLVPNFGRMRIIR